MDEVIVGSWPAHKLGPSAIFEHIELDTLGMVMELDRKMRTLALPAGYTKKMFGKWLSAVRELASAVIFHGGEVVSESVEPLTAIVVTESADERKEMLGKFEGKAYAGVMEIGVVSIMEFPPLAIPREGGSVLRPFLSSELLVLGAERDVEMMEAFFGQLRSAFESQCTDDLAKLISADIRKVVFRDLGPDAAGKKPKMPIRMEETDYSGKRPIKKRVIDESEFERMAIKAMHRRRVPTGLQSFIMPKVKMAAGCAAQS